VDGLWPRGVSKEEAQLDAWWKEAPPSTEHRNWFGHKPERWASFSHEYLQELTENAEPIHQYLADVDQQKRLTLLYAAKDKKHTHALVLQNYLKKQVNKSR